MNIGGFEKNSFVDYPGQISAVIFTKGCNMACFYCHNKQLIEGKSETVNKDEILEYLRKRKDVLDAVVITGGEPTLQPDLIDFIKSVKEIGFKIKLDTNGSNPKLINDVINQGLVDYIAMDIKAPLDKYNELCGNNFSVNNIKESINILLKSNIEYEFRTTFIPQLTKLDIYSMANAIKGAKRYFIQQYRPVEIDNPDIDVLGAKITANPHEGSYIKNIKDDLNNFLHCESRGVSDQTYTAVFNSEYSKSDIASILGNFSSDIVINDENNLTFESYIKGQIKKVVTEEYKYLFPVGLPQEKLDMITNIVANDEYIHNYIKESIDENLDNYISFDLKISKEEKAEIIKLYKEISKSKEYEDLKSVFLLENKIMTPKEIQDKYQDLKNSLPESDPLRKAYYKANYAISGALSRESMDNKKDLGTKTNIKEKNRE